MKDPARVLLFQQTTFKFLFLHTCDERYASISIYIYIYIYIYETVPNKIAAITLGTAAVSLGINWGVAIDNCPIIEY